MKAACFRGLVIIIIIGLLPFVNDFAGCIVS